ncbi:MAG: T9SS type A sorting domain-containing protein, partial [Saprospiraceae bacterium]
PNHVGVSSDFALAVNLGGALGDKSWLDAGDIPIISFHAFNDPFAPCGTGIVNVPPPVNLPVVEVDGSCTFQPVVNSLGLNDVFVNANFQDDITAYASANNGGIEGFYPIYGDDSSPWAFASSAEPYGVSGSDCDVSSSVSDNFRDTILSYFLPRACALFGLNADCALTTGLEKFTSIEVGMTASPNPATDAFVLKTDKRFVMNRVELVDMTGRVVRELNAVNSSTTTVETQGLDAGIYFARVYFKEGIATQKVVLH